MTPDDLRISVQKYVDVWKARDPKTIALFHAPEGLVESLTYAMLRGRQAIEEAARAFFKSFPDATFDLEAIVVEAQRVAIFTRISATHVNEFFGLPGTNRHIEFRSAQLLETDGQGLIVHERRVYDYTGLLVQIGVLKAKPARA